MQDHLLDIRNLRVTFATPAGPNEALRGVSFAMGREKIGIVGESGSGKSLTGKSILGLTPGRASVTADRLMFDGQDMLTMPPRQLRQIRGRRIGLVMQDPKYCLNPVKTVGRQIATAAIAGRGMTMAAARAETVRVLRAVQISDPERVMRAYPHEVSGGMAQRIMLAMMVVCEPDLLIADEPTSALDVTVQLEVLALLDQLITARGMGLIFISHDLRLVSQFCDRVIVMYAGRIVESLAANQLHNAQHPYTRGLMNCLPAIDHKPGQRLPVLKREASWITE
ncbi:ABC transporter ATP-binding protein [Primorskyibacter flagellatus]|uniref:ABC transporter ATP-binding protein n=1 Tax=Primorskyibacter flagellatus TaxID=1387277 RepID=A0A917AFX7_9RHOB|nr:ABC transporter ATP-binding protein [Primorskyibacter flagellatus]GGE50212.1 ABC transporter ATP-binding protein [Primorskyibacter flagellatus]